MVSLIWAKLCPLMMRQTRRLSRSSRRKSRNKIRRRKPRRVHLIRILLKPSQRSPRTRRRYQNRKRSVSRLAQIRRMMIKVVLLKRKNHHQKRRKKRKSLKRKRQRKIQRRIRKKMNQRTVVVFSGMRMHLKQQKKYPKVRRK